MNFNFIKIMFQCKYIHIFVLFLLIQNSFAQTTEFIPNEALIRNANSIEIQICIESNIIFSSDYKNFVNHVLAELKSFLKTNAVYFIKNFKSVSSIESNCAMFVFQSNNPEEARKSVFDLETKFIKTIYNNQELFMNTKAKPWNSYDQNLLGLDWNVNANDLVIWGGGFGFIIILVSIGMCFYSRFVYMKENEMMKELIHTVHQKMDEPNLKNNIFNKKEGPNAILTTKVKTINK